MPNDDHDHQTEPLIPGMQAVPPTHDEATPPTVGEADTPAQAGTSAHQAPTFASGSSSSGSADRWSLSEAWSGRNPGQFVGLIALAVIAAVALVAGTAMQTAAATHALSAIGARLHGPGQPDLRLFDGPGRAHGPEGRQQPGPQHGRDRGDRSPRGSFGVPGLPGLRQAEHGEVVVDGAGGAATTVRFLRGQVTAVSPTSLTVKCSDGFTTDFAVNSDTKVGKGMRGSRQSPNRAPGAKNITDIAVGDTVIAVGNVVDKTVTATTVVAMPNGQQSGTAPAPTGPTT